MKTYIVDIDGTLANIEHRLPLIQCEPKQWDAFFDACTDDKPIEDVIDVVRALYHSKDEVRIKIAAGKETQHIDERSENSISIVYLTGRPERVRNKTIDWLMGNGLPKGGLYMRRDGDYRPDTIAKRSLLEGLIADGVKIAGVFEDRPSVCKVWRSMGLTVFQMQHEEF